MSLTSLTSNLEKITKAFGSDTKTGNVKDSSGKLSRDLVTAVLPKTNFFDSKGDMYPRFNLSTKFQNPEDRSNSQLEIMWDDRKKDYYAQAKGKGELGYRNNDVTGFDQPFVIRDIGDRWGKYDSFGLGGSKFGNNIAIKIPNITKNGDGLSKNFIILRYQYYPYLLEIFLQNP